MKITTLVIRTLIGLFLLFASITYFFDLMPQPPATGNMKTFVDGVGATGYLMTLAKWTELLCGLSFVSNKFTSLFAVILMPVSLNILLINMFLMPDGIGIAALLFLGNAFIMYANWNNYKGLLKA
jgi:hypothetical protein